MKVKDLLTDESKWIQQADAKTIEGFCVLAESPDACQWCLIGAILKCYRDIDEFSRVSIKIKKELNINSIILWNDDIERKFKDVQNLVNKLDI